MAGKKKTQTKSMSAIDSKAAANAVAEAIAKLKGSRKFLFQILDMFPVPIEIFEPGGTSVFFNRAGLELNNIKNPGLLIGKYNLLNDPVCNDQMGLREEIRKAFLGETIAVVDFIPPIQDLLDRGVTKEKPFEKAFMDLFMYPVWNGEELVFIVCVFIVKNMYRGRPDVLKAKEYIDNYWYRDFNPKSLAKSVNMSVSQLYKLFKQDTGLTPGDYYKKCKVDHIKEKLIDKSLTIKQAFSACGEDSRGAYARVFKEVAGISPSRYREQN